jgi:hypothetical protein
VLARTSTHAGAGLAKRTLSGLELSSDRLELNPADMNRMKLARDVSR